MGTPLYSFSDRKLRTASFVNASVDDVFEQQKKGRMHEMMDPKKALLREARDSENHPFSAPIFLNLDITGSMQLIPKELIGEGLPKMVGKIMERGVKDPAILFAGVGDSKWDKYPFQVGQFESGDSELDGWLTKVFIEGDGGGNGGESYAWPWYFAAYHCVTDSWDKRKQKGLIVTIGNEPCHKDITSREFMDVMGITRETATKEELLELARERWNVYHLCIDNRSDACPSWKELLGENAIPVKDYRDIPNIVADITAKVFSAYVNSPVIITPQVDQSIKPETKITL